jgi:hypothetical protein
MDGFSGARGSFVLMSKSTRATTKRKRRDPSVIVASSKSTLELRTSGDSIELQAADPNTPDALPSFSGIAYTGGVMNPKLAIQWNGPVVIDLAGLDAPVGPVHRDHDESRPVGHLTAVANDGTKLSVTGVFSVPSVDQQEIIAGAKNGFPWRPSVGVKILTYSTIPQGQTLQCNGRTFDGPILVIKRSQLKEVSLVTIAGDPDSSVSIAASANPNMPTFDDYCKSLGLDPATLSPEAKTALQVSYAESIEPAADASDPPADPAPQPPTATASQPTEPPMTKPVTAAASSASPDLTAAGGLDLTAYRSQMAAETKRVNDVTTLCARFGSPTVMVGGKNVDLAAHAIENGLTGDQTELLARRHQDLEASRNSRPHGPAIHSRSSHSSIDLGALQGGIMLRAEMRLDSPTLAKPDVKAKLPRFLQAGLNDPIRQQTMEAAHQYRDLTLLESCKLGLQARGIDVPANRVDMLQASFSSGTVAALFGATLGAKMLESYAEVDDFSAGICSESERPDLEEHNNNRMQAAPNLKHHPVGGKAKHGNRRVLTEKAQVGRFSEQLKIDEADMFGDNFGKLKDTPQDFGRAAGRLRPDLVAALLMSNPTLLQTARALFNTTDGNSATGKALARATLSEMIARLLKVKDGDATLNLKMSHLIVPPELMDLAIQLCYSANLSNDSGSGEMNPLKKYGVTPVTDARFSNGLVHPVTEQAIAGSDTTYYGMSKDGRTIEVNYLQGAGRVPVVRVETLVGGEFGVVIDVKHYIGVNALDFRAVQRFAA